MAPLGLELDRARAADAGGGDLTFDVLEPSGMTTLIRWGAPVTGFLMGSTSVSRTPGMRRRAVRASLSNSNEIGAKIGSCIFVTMSVTMWKSVPSAEFCPDMILNRASRCSGVARSSMMGWISPLPSCSGPGKWTVTKKLKPSSETSSKWPCVIRMPRKPRHSPFVGRALKSHGQP